ncbi:RNA 2',3'-cyclic phosphodiesterase [Paenibacillus sp. HJL G12]|uniref:RNA 2',3'-cyclic phosphodiesterase n=1 Tax=Paenibacillus dendrobii TaxID=2691084 RepID=A0A7X3LGY4_9BACL|nr:RNA 2',3'-cyclic phosphodiesterase [Paenibacillus dendrobii]MWV44557.1 RNA 2',3'-cyclic phosphodiesterase [Paenibacillus dendrobii]
MSEQIKAQPLRLFIAIRLSEILGSALEQWRQEQQTALTFKKWTHREDYHITVQFLGDVDPEQVPAIANELRKIADQFQPFVLGIGKAGIFGLEASPRVLWAGVIDHNHLLTRLQEFVTNGMEKFGFARESRPYHPHITIARKYAGNEPFQMNLLPSLLPQTATLEEGKREGFWTVDEFVLFSTHLHDRPMYEILETFRMED